MIKRLKLKNFGCHTDLEVNFGRGMQMIKGVNEAGKSTLLLALVYAFGGARALPKTLVRMVTWGQPEASLRVELDFDHAGQAFSITRHKNGAELRGPGVTASGQDEVTRFVYGLFGITQDMLPKLLLAKQSGLQEALAAGTTSTLIEKLSNVGLIDELINLVQTELPSGNLKPIQALLEAESANLAPVRPSTAALEVEALEAEGKAQAVHSQVTACNKELDLLDAAGARRVVDQAAAVRKALDTAEAALRASVATLAGLPPPDEEPSRLEQLRRQQATADEAAAKQKVLQDAWERFGRLPSGDTIWEGSLESLKKAGLAAQARAAGAATTLAQIAKDLGVAEGSLVKSGECGFCGKVLDDVPEVIQRNQTLQEQIQALTARKVLTTNGQREAQAEGAALEGIHAVHQSRETLVAKIPDYLLTADRSTVPHTYTWAGPDMSVPRADFPTYKQEIAQEKARLDAVAAANVAREKARTAVETHTQTLAQVTAQLGALDVVEAKATLGRAAALAGQVKALQATQRRHEETASQARLSIAMVMRTYDEQERAHKASLARREDLKATLATMAKHNTIVSKLRDARPEVARQLWATVEGTISFHFSKIRGVTSVVTRSPEGFLVDGHLIDDHSGSTMDSLGLAIRIGLTKTFLPSCRFMLFDEPAAAANDEREANMLGALAGADYDQIIMVTHSNLADSFADNIIQI